MLGMLLLVNSFAWACQLLSSLRRKIFRMSPPPLEIEPPENAGRASSEDNEAKKILTGSENGERKPCVNNQSAAAKFGTEPPNYEFGHKLSDFGYKFNDEGKLVNLMTGSKFDFDVKPDDKAYNQRHYEALGEVINEEVYSMLEKKCGLKRHPIPINAEEGEPSGFLFASADIFSNEKMLILIHGSGVVRAGQWARRLIVNESLQCGTQMPYIEKAKKMGFSVVVLNTNQNMVKDPATDRNRHIRGSEDAFLHATYAWDNYICKSRAKNIAIVAHSAGGYATVELARARQKDFVDHVFAVAFTDSSHFAISGQSKAWDHLMKVTCNWVCSSAPLGTPLPNHYREELKRVSAGTVIHESTSHTAIDCVFDFLSFRLNDWLEIKKIDLNQNCDQVRGKNKKRPDYQSDLTGDEKVKKLQIFDDSSVLAKAIFGRSAQKTISSDEKCVDKT